jgi:DNA-binding beta-propeller fold protein YncE
VASGTNTISTFDVTSGLPTDGHNVPLPRGANRPISLSVHPAGTWLYVVNRESRNLTVYALRDGLPTQGRNVRAEFLGVADNPTRPAAATLNQDGTRLHVLNTGSTPFETAYSTIVVYDVSRGVPSRPALMDLEQYLGAHRWFDGGPAASGLVLDPTGATLYLDDEERPQHSPRLTIYTVDAAEYDRRASPTGCRQTAPVPPHSGNSLVMIGNGSGCWLYALGLHGTLATYQVSGRQVERRDPAETPVPNWDRAAMVANAAGTHLYLVTRRSPEVAVFDISRGIPEGMNGLPLRPPRNLPRSVP